MSKTERIERIIVSVICGIVAFALLPKLHGWEYLGLFAYSLGVTSFSKLWGGLGEQ